MPERIVRNYLFSKGFRFRKNDSRFPGSPDVVLPMYNTLIFVHGCFWHMHEGCSKSIFPASNQDYWIPKLIRNQKRDKKNINLLKNMGWHVIIIWECELKKKFEIKG